MRTKLFAGVAFAALIIPASAYAQSTGSVDFEDQGTEIVVTGSRVNDGVNGIVVPDTTKAKAVLTADFIQRQVPGQTVNDIINQLPGVSFQNNDPYGSSGGSMSIRGFDNSRISQTFDGVPLNDSGNYAIYSNQQLDPELIEQVNVNLGSTDIDSPTASATGSTVNYRTIVPGEDFGVKLIGTVGDFDYFRTFGLVNTGEFTSFGTRAFFAASQARNHSPFNRDSQIEKQQYNARVYQPLGNNGDFLSIAGNWNENRNNFQGSVPLRNDTVQRSVGCAVTVPTGGTCPTGQQVITTTPRVVGPNSSDRFPFGLDEAHYTVAPCQTNQQARAGTADLANSCGSIFDERFNPSNTGNIRGSARFTLSDGLVLTVDPSYQYVKANGGGTVVGQEARRDVFPAGGAANCNSTPNGAQVSCQVGYIGGVPYYGRDLNGDGDLLDTIRVLAPSQTQTHRLGLISSLRYDITPEHTIRVGYTYDRARHRQTGETGLLQLNGKPFDVFPVNDGLADVNGRILQKRDRLSFAILHQVFAEYHGEYFDGQFIVNAGLTGKFFKRNLTNYCATSSASGFVECFNGDSAALAAWLAGTPTQPATATTAAFPTQGPQQRVLNYKKVLPSIGYTWSLTPQVDVFGNFSQGIQVPGTDNLYNAFYFPRNTPQANPKPETTDNFDLGVRYRSSKIQAQLSGWYTNYQNRLASSYDPELDRSVYRNLGKVKKYGIDGTIAYAPIRALSFYAFGSYLKSEIQDNVEVFRTTAAGPLGPIGTIISAPTKGKRESNAPTYTFGGGATLDLDYVSLGVDVKRTGPRYLYDTNEPARQTLVVNGNSQTFIIYDSKAPAYTLVNLNARVGLDWAGLNKNTYFQLNVLNAFNQFWVGSINSGNGALNQGPTFNAQGAITGYNTPPNTQIGYPRTFVGSLVVGF